MCGARLTSPSQRAGAVRLSGLSGSLSTRCNSESGRHNHLPADAGADGNGRVEAEAVRGIGAAQPVESVEALARGLAVEGAPCRTREVRTVVSVLEQARTLRGGTRISTGPRLVAERRGVSGAEGSGVAGVGATTAARHQNSSESE